MEEPTIARIDTMARFPRPVQGEEYQRFVVIDVCDIGELVLEPHEKQQLLIMLQQFDEYRTAHVANGVLIVGADMGSLNGLLLDVAVIQFKERVILQVMRFCSTVRPMLVQA